MFHKEDELSNFDVDIISSIATFSNIDDEELEDQESQYMKVFSQHQEESDVECKSEVDRYLSSWYKATTQDLISYFSGRLMHSNILFSQR